jgi:hypothetical protein
MTIQDQIRSMKKMGCGRKRIAEQLGISEWRVRMTPEDGTVEKEIVNEWEVAAVVDGSMTKIPLRQTKTVYARGPETVTLDDLREAVANVSIPKRSPVVEITSGNMVEVSIPDAHIGKLARGQETLKQSVDAYLRVFSHLLERAGRFHPEKIVIPIGNDFVHSDTQFGTTTKGTVVNSTCRPGDLFKAGLGAVMTCIEWATSFAERVAVIVIPGNHDKLSAIHLGNALSAVYEKINDGRVTVDDDPATRKYMRWGAVLLGWCHGGKDDPKQTNLPLIMAEECPKDWGETTCREWHIGDQHRRRKYETHGTESYPGVVVRTIPSLSPTDDWHHEHGFISGQRCAEAYIWNKKSGYVGHLSQSA